MTVSSALSVAISSSLGLLFGLLVSSRSDVAAAGVLRAVAGVCRRERAEQAERALERGEVLAHLLLHRLERRGAEGVGESPPILLLLAGERIEAEFEIARHQPLHAVAIEADQLTQEADGEQIGAPAFLLDDDLGKD